MQDSLTTAVILAGGLATRLRPITETIPKILVPVAGRPFVEHQLSVLRRNGITRVVFCLGHIAEQVVKFVGDGSRYQVEALYSLDGDELLGTGGALRKAAPLAHGTFFCLYGDSLLDIDYQSVARAHLAAEFSATMTVFHNADLGDVSNVWIKDGCLQIYSKKNRLAEMQHIDYGLSVIESEGFLASTVPGKFDLSDWYSDLSLRQSLGWFEVYERFYEIGSPEGLRETEKYLLQDRAGESL
jgi:NDP-sugar pyrophosphorylase family protein